MAEACPPLATYAAMSAHLPAAKRAMWHREQAERMGVDLNPWATTTLIRAVQRAIAAHRALAAAFAPGACRDG